MARGFVFATLRRANGYGLGVRTDRGVLDVVAAEQDLKEGAPTTITDVLDGRGDLDGLRRLTEKASDKHFVAIDKAAFGPCVTHPEKIICVGLNYRKHAAETDNRRCRRQPIAVHQVQHRAQQSRRRRSRVSKEDATEFRLRGRTRGRHRQDRQATSARRMRSSHIFGYATGNDFTARDLQARSTLLGKSLDGAAPVGPWLVTSDLADGDNLKIECRVNGEVRQSSNTADMVFNCQQLVAYASRYFTLKPGDLIFTGTPRGRHPRASRRTSRCG